ncbi:nucleotide-binding protein [Rhizobium laguerreae]|uniref:nucleotide-binding protein n=1 Tax=Rhizobium laguerreae TaxID=1076926 RepID=UPI001C8FE6D8|nr:hypothetical protein [Rhizobium laguerreae]MBY3314742.1 hypothetical protein [Rhizobium laguerreae]
MTATKAKSSTALTKRLILIVNNKGGVGKSVIARQLADVLRETGKVVEVYDTDGGTGSLLLANGSRDENGALLREQDAKVGIGYFDIRLDRDRNKLLDNLSSGADTIVCDMAGGSLGEISRIIDDGDGVDGFINAAERHGYQIVIMNVLSNVQGATTSVRDYLKAFGERAQHVAVINTTWGKDEADFPFWYGYDAADGTRKGGKTKQEFEALGGKEIHFPALQPGNFAKADAAQMPFSQYVKLEDLTITERERVNKFNQKAREAFLEIANIIGL